MGLKNLFIVKLYAKLSLAGIDHDTPEELRKHIMLTNSINLTTLTLIIPYSILFIALGLTTLGLMLGSCFFLFAFFHYLNSEKQYLLARVLILIGLNFILCFFAVALGRFSGLHFLYVVFVTLPVLLFERKNYLLMILFALMSVTAFLIVRFEVIPSNIQVDNGVQQVISVSIIGLTFVWLFLNKYYLMKANDSIEESLRKKNLELNTEIEKRIRAEETLKQSNQLLEHKNKELEQLTYVTSHDLQEPLRTIASYVELLEKDYGGKMDEKGNLYMNYVVKSTYRLKKLIKDLLDYTLIGRNRTLAIVNTNELLKELLEDLAPFIKENNAAVIVQPLPNVRAHATDLKLLFLNLIINAVKFKQHDKPPVIKITGKETDDFWKFSVTDNGIGIEPKFLSRIFIIFQRLHSKHEYEGNGIGLAHSKKIVEIHGGQIWAESEPGAGSTFYFTLNKHIHESGEET